VREQSEKTTEATFPCLTGGSSSALS